MEDQEIRESLRAFTNFMSPVSEEEFNEYANLFRVVKVKKWDHLYREGEPIKSLYFLHSGALRCYYMNDGEEHTSNFFFNPYMLADLDSVRDSSPGLSNAQAMKDSVCFEADFFEVEKLAFKYPNLLKGFFLIYEASLRASIKRQVSFIYDTPKQRYLNLFTEHPNIIAEIPQHHIASYLGIKPETLSRIRKKIF
ncbi:Crp/Fnr family transcriptional regulator [Mucilaginibacter sp. JRF]|uniref:Crp/Fnr family transcriptional regulator n=1 Tax=Mucilaginibacter sp. JRF TaxID=2780088 RepID=UPI00188305E2|nr:Crp/Fnr family transcriptional regulator [Mucilaginibacter sp. JRF]MBE9583318.1 Crp/Fnr family transcriptional regulator [Mucilaginibacter sp. JRF]